MTSNAGTFGRQTLAAGQALFAHGDASHPLQLSARGKPCKILLATEMICSYANIMVRQDLYRERHQFRREAPELQARRWRQADRRRHRTGVRHLGVRHLCVRGARSRPQGKLGRRRRSQHDVPIAPDQAVRRHHGAAELDRRSREEGFWQDRLRHLQARRVRKGFQRHATRSRGAADVSRKRRLRG
ncbi:hypothetical protein BcanWSM471_07765 [Bradyrhizobium sp. WSM471]|nr:MULTISPECIES: hypothetical protein [Bradyrhizobium]UFW44922.1 hypothetical protein BcanWSM471_07765 [Bradyrhizobium canariense]